MPRLEDPQYAFDALNMEGTQEEILKQLLAYPRAGMMAVYLTRIADAGSQEDRYVNIARAFVEAVEKLYPRPSYDGGKTARLLIDDVLLSSKPSAFRIPPGEDDYEIEGAVAWIMAMCKTAFANKYMTAFKSNWSTVQHTLLGQLFYYSHKEHYSNPTFDAYVHTNAERRKILIAAYFCSLTELVKDRKTLREHTRYASQLNLDVNKAVFLDDNIPELISLTQPEAALFMNQLNNDAVIFKDDWRNVLVGVLISQLGNDRLIHNTFTENYLKAERSELPTIKYNTVEFDKLSQVMSKLELDLWKAFIY